jgi:hypothetical protein
VLDAAGRILYTKKIQLQAGSNSMVNEIPGLNKGVYYIRMFTDDKVIVKSMIN